MCCFPIEQVKPPNKRSEELVTKLEVIMFIHIGFAVIKFFIGNFGGGLMDLLICFILWQGYYTLSFCSMVMYITFVSFSLLQIFVGMGTIVQNGESLIPADKVFPAIIQYSSGAFYIIAIYFAFQAYKEFKAIAYDGGMDGSSFFMGGRSSPYGYGAVSMFI